MLLGILMLILFIVSLAIPHWGYYEYDKDLNNQNLSSVHLIYQDTTNLDNDVPPDFKFPDDYSGDYSGDHPNNNPCSEEYSGSGDCFDDLPYPSSHPCHIEYSGTGECYEDYNSPSDHPCSDEYSGSDDCSSDYSGDFSGHYPSNNPCSEEYSGSGECSKWSCSGSSDCSGDNSLLAKVTFSRRLPRARGFYHSESCKLDSNCV